MNALVPVQASNAEVYRASTDAATLCKDIVVKTAMAIQGRKYVKVEGWQAIAIAHGCTGSAREVEAIEGGVRAIGEVRRMSDGALIAQAEGFVGADEPTWYGGEVVSYGKTKTLPKRPDYAIRAMAQTRAISRACRSAFAHVVVMMDAGLSTTPAEEVPDGGFEDARQAPASASPRQSPAVGAARVAISLCKTKAALVKWKKDNASAVDAMSDPEFQAVSVAWQARMVEIETPRDEAAEAEFVDASKREMALSEDDIPW